MLLLLQRSTHAIRVSHGLLRLRFEVIHSNLGRCAPTHEPDGPSKSRLQHRGFAIRTCLAGGLACSASVWQTAATRRVADADPDQISDQCDKSQTFGPWPRRRSNLGLQPSVLGGYHYQSPAQGARCGVGAQCPRVECSSSKQGV